MSLRPATNTPAPLLVAAALVAVEGLALLGFAVLELANLDSDRVGLAVATALFFVLYGGGLIYCARSLAWLASWSRSPVVLAQLIQLGVAWNLWGGQTRAVSVGVAIVSVVVLVGVFHPASLAALADHEADHGADQD